MDQPQNRTDDADGGGIPTGCLEKFGTDFGVFLEGCQFNFHGFPKLLRIYAVHYQRDTLTGEAILYILGLLFERDEAVSPCFGGIADDVINDGFRVLLGNEDRSRCILQCLYDTFGRETHKSSSKCSPHYDNCCSWL